ncbi:PHA/PHB synthase family protein [Oceanicella actignis]|uniref:Polyhydroxyalkanoate synthase n=1 Tax=Oceanicella actignis TaxID=1189325 RepID=A0A1M7SQD5_9RHOB|nr:class I poly(R)-hydroxyalkanoic acid synthase [Oceanicella actignis]SES66667.1 polyhydroxyalkanoate synthase [Oceanicella actignis]SHN60666.1 polyhydroxyalkanoate synthase [Oceanicella actignis]
MTQSQGPEAQAGLPETAEAAAENAKAVAEFAANMAKVAERSQEIWLKLLQSSLADDRPMHFDPLNTLPAFAEFQQALMQNPQEVAERTLELWTQQAELWRRMTLRWLAGEETEPVAAPEKGDKRFSHEEWSRNLIFDYIKQSYLLASRHILGAAKEVGELDERDRKKIAFYTRNFVEALSPANFAAMNPEVIEATLRERGENLVRGLQMMAEDLERGKGRLLVRQTDMKAFEVGRDMATTPGKVIHQNEIMQLIQYAPRTEKVHATPLLFIPPWINKYYILDLNEKKSMVRWLVDQGFTVFMISWVNPDERQKDETWDSYMQKGALEAIDVALRETGQKSLNLASYCIGGTLTGTLMAWMGKRGDKRVKSATFFTAQLDFQDAGELQVFVDEKTVQVENEQMDKGYLPAQDMAMAFNMLRSSDLIWSYVINNYYLGKEPFPFDLLYWNADSTAMPARVHHFYLDQFYNRNAFAEGELTVLGETVSPADIRGPVYHVATKEDHIAPAASVYRGARAMTNAQPRFVLAGSGHIAGVVNPPELKKYQHWVNEDLSPETLEEWLAAAEERPGSWWPDWAEWLRKRSGRLVAARQPGAVNGVIEDAPGSYVKKRFDQ